ncbi:MAG: T9SS type A sorting domain-containing protein [Bacteroidales bacterium]|nr:T9SS type A sorting domain-containing protein [Bacteroidales bacterium]
MKIRKFVLFAVLMMGSFVIFSQENNQGRNINSKPKEVVNQKVETHKDSQEFISDIDNPDKDVVVSDDQIVLGNIGVGVDCIDGESFGYNTILLKENNVRIRFEDTSVDPFPGNDWTLIANSTVSGGENYFALEDGTALTIPVIVMAGAPTDALRVAANGNIGLSTSNPLVDLHMKSSNTPTIRLEQDNTGGWAAQTWDIGGNESSFFIRNVTGTNAIPFKITSTAPANTLCLNSNGVGIGTLNPQKALHVVGNAQIDYSLTIGAIETPASPALGEMFMDATDSTMKYFDGQTWSLMTDNQDLVDATLTGTILEIQIEDGESVSVDLFPLIEDLEARISALEDQVNGTKEHLYTSARLFQNYPNPFVVETSIPLFIPTEIEDAKLVIYDLKGVIIKTIYISERGHCSVTISEKDVNNGTYFYSLILDSRELESKILIKVD